MNFITETYLKEKSPITTNVDPKDLYPHIDSAEKLFTRVILGSSFYDYLIDKFESQTLNSDETELVQNYVKPAVMWRTLVLALPWINYNLRNKGIMQNTDDNANTTDFGIYRYMQNEAKNRAEQSENELQKYLCKNASDFPQYQNQDGLTPPNKSTNWDSGLIMY